MTNLEYMVAGTLVQGFVSIGIDNVEYCKSKTIN